MTMNESRAGGGCGIRLENDDVAAALSAALATAAPNGTLDLDPERVERDLACLVLTLIEFLRRLLELQAIRRMEAGSLSPEQEERVGLALMRAADQVSRVAAQFGVAPQELNLVLGPLGRLM
jgi:hypothetical protein